MHAGVGTRLVLASPQADGTVRGWTRRLRPRDRQLAVCHCSQLTHSTRKLFSKLYCGDEGCHVDLSTSLDLAILANFPSLFTLGARATTTFDKNDENEGVRRMGWNFAVKTARKLRNL